MNLLCIEIKCNCTNVSNDGDELQKTKNPKTRNLNHNLKKTFLSHLNFKSFNNNFVKKTKKPQGNGFRQSLDLLCSKTQRIKTKDEKSKSDSQQISEILYNANKTLTLSSKSVSAFDVKENWDTEEIYPSNVPSEKTNTFEGDIPFYRNFLSETTITNEIGSYKESNSVEDYTKIYGSCTSRPSHYYSLTPLNKATNMTGDVFPEFLADNIIKSNNTFKNNILPFNTTSTIHNLKDGECDLSDFSHINLDTTNDDIQTTPTFKKEDIKELVETNELKQSVTNINKLKNKNMINKKIIQKCFIEAFEYSLSQYDNIKPTAPCRKKRKVNINKLGSNFPSFLNSENKVPNIFSESDTKLCSKSFMNHSSDLSKVSLILQSLNIPFKTDKRKRILSIKIKKQKLPFITKEGETVRESCESWTDLTETPTSCSLIKNKPLLPNDKSQNSSDVSRLDISNIDGINTEDQITNILDNSFECEPISELVQNSCNDKNETMDIEINNNLLKCSHTGLNTEIELIAFELINEVVKINNEQLTTPSVNKTSKDPSSLINDLSTTKQVNPNTCSSYLTSIDQNCLDVVSEEDTSKEKMCTALDLQDTNNTSTASEYQNDCDENKLLESNEEALNYEESENQTNKLLNESYSESKTSCQWTLLENQYQLYDIIEEPEPSTISESLGTLVQKDFEIKSNKKTSIKSKRNQTSKIKTINQDTSNTDVLPNDNIVKTSKNKIVTRSKDAREKETVKAPRAHKKCKAGNSGDLEANKIKAKNSKTTSKINHCNDITEVKSQQDIQTKKESTLNKNHIKERQHVKSNNHMKSRTKDTAHFLKKGDTFTEKRATVKDENSEKNIELHQKNISKFNNQLQKDADKLLKAIERQMSPRSKAKIDKRVRFCEIVHSNEGNIRPLSGKVINRKSNLQKVSLTDTTREKMSLVKNQTLDQKPPCKSECISNAPECLSLNIYQEVVSTSESYKESDHESYTDTYTFNTLSGN